MGNTASKIHEWFESQLSFGGIHNINSSSKNKTRPMHDGASASTPLSIDNDNDPKNNKGLPIQEVSRHTIPEHINGLLSLITKERLKEVIENRYYMGIKEKTDCDYDVNYPKIMEGTIAEEFQSYLRTISPEHGLKFSFLVIAELVLESKDEELFHHLASIFFDKSDSKYNINLRNKFAQDKLFEHLTTKSLKFEECLNLLKKKGKLGPDMLSHNGGIASVYKEFREIKLEENSKRCACLLSIL